MSINKFKFLIFQLLIVLCLGIDGWARPLLQEEDASVNEVNPELAELPEIRNKLIEELFTRPNFGNFKKRRPFNPYKPHYLQPGQYGGRFYNTGYPETVFIPPGGVNYLGNEVPLSTYGMFQPELMYY